MSAGICPNHPPGHDWDNGLNCRWCDATRTPGEAIESGLASRRGGSREAARALMDAYRSEVGEVWPGELDHLRSLARTLTRVADAGDLTAVQRQLAAHQRIDTRRRTEANTPGADPTTLNSRKDVRP